MKRLVFITFLTFVALNLFSSERVIWAEDAVNVTFESLKCKVCHKPDRRSTGPSLPEISKAYSGQQQRLVQYLKGESEPLIDLGRREMMERKLEITRELSDTERRDLADYLLSFGGK